MICSPEAHCQKPPHTRFPSRPPLLSSGGGQTGAPRAVNAVQRHCASGDGCPGAPRARREGRGRAPPVHPAVTRASPGVPAVSARDHGGDASFRQHSNHSLSPQTEIVPRDLRMKDKFLKHLTGRLSLTPHLPPTRPLHPDSPHDLCLPHLPGPLYFSPKCSKHFHRLYHNTRDCTVPACEWRGRAVPGTGGGRPVPTPSHLPTGAFLAHPLPAMGPSCRPVKKVMTSGSSQGPT